MHTNLTWLLQYSEVQVMTGIWRKLKLLNIPFLTIHDELPCREQDQKKVFETMNEELKKHFKYLRLMLRQMLEHMGHQTQVIKEMIHRK